MSISALGRRFWRCCTSTYKPHIPCRISHMLPVSTGLTGYTQTIYIQQPTTQALCCIRLQSSAWAIPDGNTAAVISQRGDLQLWRQSVTDVPLHIANTLTFHPAGFLTSHGIKPPSPSVWTTFWRIFCFLLSLPCWTFSSQPSAETFTSIFLPSFLPLRILQCSYVIYRSG